jgi:hypothetical protein
MLTDKPEKAKPLTIKEFSRRGGLARARKYSKKQLREWSKLGGKLGGRPRKNKPKSRRSSTGIKKPTASHRRQKG